MIITVCRKSDEIKKYGGNVGNCRIIADGFDCIAIIGVVEEERDNSEVKTVFSEDSLCEKLYEKIY